MALIDVNWGTVMIDEGFHCSVCGREITKEECEAYGGMCWACWDDRLAEESDSMFDDLMQCCRL